jgi:hypothetical protein
LLASLPLLGVRADAGARVRVPQRLGDDLVALAMMGVFRVSVCGSVECEVFVNDAVWRNVGYAPCTSLHLGNYSTTALYIHAALTQYVSREAGSVDSVFVAGLPTAKPAVVAD